MGYTLGHFIVGCTCRDVWYWNCMPLEINICSKFHTKWFTWTHSLELNYSILNVSMWQWWVSMDVIIWDLLRLSLHLTNNI